MTSRVEGGRRDAMRRALGWTLLALGGVVFWWWRRVESHISLPVLDLLNYDSYAYYMPAFRYAFGSLRAGDIPWWNPWQLCGTPFFATAQHLILYPLSLLYWVLPTGSAMKWSAILHLVIAFLSTVLLGRELGLARLGALVWAVAFTFCGSTVALLYVPHHLYGGAWMPLALLLAHRVTAGPAPGRAAAALGLVFGIQYLGGYPMYGLFTVYLVGLYVPFRWFVTRIWQRPQELTRQIGAFLFGALLAALLAAPQLLPALELARQSPRDLSAITVEAGDPLGARGMASGFPVALLQNLVLPAWGSAFPRTGSVGTVGFVLALFAFSHRRRRDLALFLAGVAAISLALSLGALTFVYRLYVELPTGSWFRVPGRFLFLSSFALAGLAGVGADVLAATPWTGRRRWALAVVPAAVYLELFVAFANIVPIPDVQPDFYRMPPSVAGFLRDHQEFARSYFATRREVTGFPGIPPKSGMTERIYAAADRENVFPSRFAQWAAFLESGDEPSKVRLSQGELVANVDSKALPLLDLMGVRYVVEAPIGTFQPLDQPELYRTVFRDELIRVLENPAAVPRARLVSHVEVIAEPRAILERLASRDFSPLTSTVLEAPPPPFQSRGAPLAGPSVRDAVELVRVEPEEVEVRVTTGRAGFLVLSDQFYPGWRAEVDGQERPILRADFLFRAVPVEPGSHVVRFVFEPFGRRLLGG